MEKKWSGRFYAAISFNMAAVTLLSGIKYSIVFSLRTLRLCEIKNKSIACPGQLV